MTTFSVYALAEPTDPSAIRYVGVSSNPEKRLASHLSRSASVKVVQWVRSLSADPVLAVLEVCDSEARALAAERAWIAILRADGVQLLNRTWGGEQRRRRVYKQTGFGARVKAAREALSLNQAALASLAGIDQPRLSRLESGKREGVSAQVAVLIAKVLHTTVEYLVTGEQN